MVSMRERPKQSTHKQSEAELKETGERSHEMRLEAARRFTKEERVMVEMLPGKYERGIVKDIDPKTGFLSIELEAWEDLQEPGSYDPRSIEKIH